MVRWLLVLIGIVLLGLRIWYQSERQFPYQLGQRVRITAVVRTEPIKIYQKHYLVVEEIVVEIPPEISVEYGDRIEVIGTLGSGVTGIKSAQFGLLQPHFQVISHQLSILAGVNQMRQRLIRGLTRWLPADEAALDAGIVLGGTEGMSSQLKLAFRRTGLAHIVAASGYNVTVVAGWTMLLFTRWFHRRLAIILGICSIIGYVLLAGATAAVVRAGIMSTSAWIGQLWGREADSMWLLGLAGWAMLMGNPAYASDIGFQLSMAATAGILWFRPAGNLWATLAAQAATLPLILHHFGDLSVIAPLANILLLWLVPPIMQVGAIGLVIGPVNWLVWPMLKLMTTTVIFLSGWSWSNWQVGQLSWWWVGAYYLAVILIAQIAKLKSQTYSSKP